VAAELTTAIPVEADSTVVRAAFGDFWDSKPDGGTGALRSFWAARTAF